MSTPTPAILDWLLALEFAATDYDVGEVLIEEGTSGKTVYVLCSGAVSITQRLKELARVDTAGAMLGEIAAILKVPRTATVTVLERSRFYVIEDLEEFITENPAFGMLILENMATRILDRDKNLGGIYIGLQKLREKEAEENRQEKLLADPGISSPD